jgi:transposase
MLTAGSINGCPAAEGLLSLTSIDGETILGDKAYGTKNIMAYILKNGGPFCIPPKSNTKEPWDYDKGQYKGRNVVERFFNQLKQYRAAATRYDKLAGRYFGIVLIASIMILLK